MCFSYKNVCPVTRHILTVDESDRSQALELRHLVQCSVYLSQYVLLICNV
jgi:hypothetical protein